VAEPSNNSTSAFEVSTYCCCKLARAARWLARLWRDSASSSDETAPASYCVCTSASVRSA
jgi:hypothetical protein